MTLVNRWGRSVKLKILVVTGKLAFETVSRNVADSKYDLHVHPLPVSVAAFITPQLAARNLADAGVKDYDLILLPGTVRGDVTMVEEATGIPTFKGPSNMNDLPLLLGLLDGIELSKTASATEHLSEAQNERALTEIRKVEENWPNLLKKHGGLVIGNNGHQVPIGSAFPMRVIAEIVNAPTLRLEEVKKRARYYQSEGADIVDIGMLAGRPNPESAKALVEEVKSAIDLPVSIDTLDPTEIKAAVDAGADLVLSVDAGNMNEVAPYVSNVPVVVLPTNMKEGFLPQRADERVSFLLENIERATELGIQKIIADPVLEPAIKPGLLESLNAYRLFRNQDPRTPVLYGLGNVTELFDADSVGVNGILAALAAEVEAQLLFIPEYSTKAKRSVRETSRAAKMMYLAKRRETPPKDLGIDLLVLKEKKGREPQYDSGSESGARVIHASPERDGAMDKLGWYKILVDRTNDELVAIHFDRSESPDVVLRGKNAQEVYQTIIREGLVGRLDHAAYLGKELHKAELAVLLGRSYVQDDPLF
jgi:dihydropteroate synthase-like protein